MRRILVLLLGICVLSGTLSPYAANAAYGEVEPSAQTVEVLSKLAEEPSAALAAADPSLEGLTDLVRGKEFQYYISTYLSFFPDRNGETLATDGNSNTYYTTGKLDESMDVNGVGGQLMPMLRLDKGTRYNVVRLKETLERDGQAPFNLRFVYATAGGASSSYQDLIPSSILSLKDQNEVDRIFRFPVRSEEYLGFHFNTGTSSSKTQTELRIYDLEVYYDGSLLNELSYASTAVDRSQETRIAPKVLNADGKPMTDFSDYVWGFEAIAGCQNIYGDQETGEIVIPTDAGIGTYRATLTHKEDALLSITAEVQISAPPEEWYLSFNKIVGIKSIPLPSSGTIDVKYQAYAYDDTPAPDAGNIQWRLDRSYTGVLLIGSTLTVSYRAAAGTIRLYATYDGHEIYSDITLRNSPYGTDFALGRSFEHRCDSGYNFTWSGLEYATDGDPNTYYTSGNLIGPDIGMQGGLIMPLLDLGSNLKYNVIRVNQEVTIVDSSPLYLHIVNTNAPNASSSYQELVATSVLDFGQTASFSGYVKFPVKTERYIGYYFNTGTGSGRLGTSFLCRDFEVYYDGNQLNGIQIPERVKIDGSRETRVPLSAINADGNVMDDLSAYMWEGTATQGCENVYIDTTANELVVPANATFGAYTISLTDRSNTELTFNGTIEIEADNQAMSEEFTEIRGETTLVIPKNSNADSSYYVYNRAGVRTTYSSLLHWKLAEEYQGVNLSGSTITLTPAAQAGTIVLEAYLGDYKVSIEIMLVTASASIDDIIYTIEGQKFVTAPYYGEQEISQAVYTAKTYGGAEISEGVTWSVKGAADGIAIDPETGVLSVSARAIDQKIKLIAEKDGFTTERLVTVVSRYEGAPNLLRLPGVSYGNFAVSGLENPFDGDFSTASTSRVVSSAVHCRFVLPQNYFIDEFRAYRDNGRYENSYQTTARINGQAFGGKGWSNSPLEADIWVASPAWNTDVFDYSYIPRLEPIQIYEMELYSSYMRFDRVTGEKEQIDIPGSGMATVAFLALSESGDPVENITYADGETHTVKWELLGQPEGVSIDADTGAVTVTSAAKPTTVTVMATYFGKTCSTALIVGSGSAATLAAMDYDWLTFDKLSSESPDNITYKMLLYRVGPNGSQITWSSSNARYISTAGDVELPYTAGNQNITLTAVITNGGVSLTKEFAVTVREPQKFIDKEIMTDNELFGVWDEDSNLWAVLGKLDYSASPSMAEIETAVKAHDLELAKELLYNLTVYKLRNTLDPITPSNPLNNVGAQHYMNDTVLYTTTGHGWITIGDERQWYTTDVKNIIMSTQSFSLILHSYMKEDALVEIDSRESEYAPYILVKLKNGNEMRFEPKADTTLRAGYYVNTNYGSDSVVRVMDSGYPIDSNTQRGYFAFDLGSIEDTGDIASAELYLHGENVTKTGNKEISVLYNGSASWNENTYCWADTKGIMSVFSYSGTDGSFEFSYPPGADPETLLNYIGRLYYLGIIAGGYSYTGDEKYAYTPFRLLDAYFNRCGDHNSYPRGFDGATRNVNMINMYKLLVNSPYMTPEMTTLFWKHMWIMHDQILIGRDPFYHEVDNMKLYFSNLTMTSLLDFNEFVDVQRWIDNYAEIMLPLGQSTMLPDGCYSEASHSYTYMGVTEFAKSIQKAKTMGVTLDPQLDELLHNAAYGLAALYLPNFAYAAYGNCPFGTAASSNAFLLEMADLYDDDVLRYIAAHGTQGGTKPNFTGILFRSRNRAYMRASWSDTSPYLMINIDDGASTHGDYDDLSITAWAYGDFVVTDTGMYTYTFSDPVVMELVSSENHNTLGRITDLKNDRVYLQNYDRNIQATRVDNWATGNSFDYFSGCTREDAYGDYYGDGTRIKTGYNRKVLFVKPNYWIVSDYIEDRMPENKTDNKYDIMFNLLPDSGFAIDNDAKTLKTNFSDKTNVQLLSPDADVEISNELSVYCPIAGAYTYTDRIVFSKTKPVQEKTTFDTVVYPTKPGELSAEISVVRLDTGAEPSTASAMHISRDDSSGTYDDYYYYSNEANFDDNTNFPVRSFGSFSYNGEMAFLSYHADGELVSMTVNNGSSLTADGTVLIQAENRIDDLSVYMENAQMMLESSVESAAELGNVEINAGRRIEKVTFNGSAIVFAQEDGVVKIGDDGFVTDSPVIVPDDGEAYIALPEINFGGSFSYNSKTYAVSVSIPEGTKVRPIENWNGVFHINIVSSENSTEAGRINIFAESGESLSFVTPISVYVAEHASADVYLIIDGKKVKQTRTVSSKNPEAVQLPAQSAGLYKLRDHLWILTNECTELIVERITEPTLPGGFGTGSTGGSGGSGSLGGFGGAGGSGGTAMIPENLGAENTATAGSPFTDLDGVEWAREAIEVLYQEGIVNGVSESSFAPTANITRAEFTTMACRAFDLKAEMPYQPFRDVEGGTWYTNAIANAYALGVAKGISEEEFGVNELITRQDMMVMLWRILEQRGIELTASVENAGISDWESVSDYAQEAVLHLYEAGIINGMDDGSFAPRAFAERAQAAKVFYELLRRIEL